MIDKDKIGKPIRKVELATDMATLEGVVARLHLVKLPEGREQEGNTVMLELTARNLWGMGIDMPVGYIEAMSIGGRKIEVCFYTTREGDESAGRTLPPEEDVWMNRIIEKVLAEVARITQLTRQDPQTIAREWLETETPTPTEPARPVIDGDGQAKARDSGHFNYPAQTRKEIVEKYRQARAIGNAASKNAWASQYCITGKTLLAYEREFPE